MKTRAKKPSKPRERINPLRIDPTRTGLLRAKMAKELNRKFVRFAFDVYNLVVYEDAFGLTNAIVGNVFCATGPGGGIDPTCSPDLGLQQVREHDQDRTKSSHLRTVHNFDPSQPRDRQGRWSKGPSKKSEYRGWITPDGGHIPINTDERDHIWHVDALRAETDIPNPTYEDAIHKYGYARLEVQGGKTLYVEVHYKKLGMTKDWVKKNVDPTIFDKVHYTAFGYEDSRPRESEDFTTNAPRQQWRFETRLEQLKRFEEWLRAKIAQYITSKNDELLWERYAEDGFRKGAGRAFDDAKRGDMTPAERRRDDFLREAFANPISTDKIKLLASRSFTDLKGVTEVMATAMGRTLTDGLVQGKSPREIGRDLVKTVDDIGRSRALTIARTEIVRAHAEGQLHALDKMGVREVGVAVEWSVTSVNGQPVETVCQMCRPMNGVVLSIEEAAGMIPRHPNCRCAWVPANVGEPTDKQKRTRARITAAIAASRAKERGKKKSGWGKVAISAARPKSILNNAALVYPEESSLNLVREN